MQIRVLTINLYNGRANPDSLAAALEVHQPDVVAAQELSTNSATVLADWGSSHLLDPRPDMSGMGIAVSGSATFSRLDFPHRDPIVAVLPARDWGLERDLQIFNAHLVNPVSRPIAQSIRVRAKEVAALEQIFGMPHDTASRILVGDLNSSPAWPLYRRLGNLATDAAVAAGTARRSWGPWPGSPRLLRIDHAFVQGPKPLRTTLLSISGTDHSGLLLDVEAVR